MPLLLNANRYRSLTSTTSGYLNGQFTQEVPEHTESSSLTQTGRTSPMLPSSSQLERKPMSSSDSRLLQVAVGQLTPFEMFMALL